MVNSENLQKNLELLSFPRIYGSEAEKKAYSMLKEKIEELNLPSETQSFTYTNFYSIIYGRCLFALLFWILLILVINFGGIIQNILLLIPGVLIASLYLMSRKPENIRIGRKLTSRNVFTKIIGNSGSEEGNENVILIAHMDSKGQRFNIRNRVKSYIIWFASFILLIPVILFKNFFFEQTYLGFILLVIGTVFLAFNLFGVVLLFLNVTINHSNGALDDASGMTCVLELLSHYANNGRGDSTNLNLWFLFTGGEEGGTMGIRKFYNEQLNSEIDKSKYLIINFDAIGTSVDLIKFGFTRHKKIRLQEFMIDTAFKDLNWKIKTHSVPIGVHTDGYHLFKKGFNGIELGDWDCYQYLHTIHDTVDKVDISILKNTCELVIKTIAEINKGYNNSK